MRPWFLQRFERVMPAGGEKWRAECPRCGGKRDLSVFAGDHETWIVKCFAGCPPHELLAIVDLRCDDLLYESEGTSSSSSQGGTPLRSTVVDRRPLSHGDANDEREGELDGLLERHAEGRLGYVPPVELPPLPDDALEVDRLVAGFFAHVHALRQWAGMQPKVMFSSHWVAAKLGLHQKTVWRSLRRLEEAGVLAPAGSLPGRGGWHGPGLYLPGDGVASAVAPREGNVVNLADRRTA